MQAAIVCYARAVAGLEWAAMGDGETSDVPSTWTGTRAFGGIRAAFKSLSTKVDPANVYMDKLLSADEDRGDFRRDRLALASRRSRPSSRGSC